MKWKKFFFWCIPLAFILFLLALPELFENANATQFDYHNFQISGKISNEQDVANAFNVIETNLAAVSANDTERYISTLVLSAQEESKQEIHDFFQEHTVKQSILNVKVKQQEKNKIIFEIQQKSIAQGDSDYRNHIATAVHTLVKEKDQWRIAETIMSDTKFI